MWPIHLFYFMEAKIELATDERMLLITYRQRLSGFVISANRARCLVSQIKLNCLRERATGYGDRPIIGPD